MKAVVNIMMQLYDQEEIMGVHDIGGGKGRRNPCDS